MAYTRFLSSATVSIVSPNSLEFRGKRYNWYQFAPISALAENRWSLCRLNGNPVNFLEARLNEALGADAFACPVSAVVCERIRLGHKEITYDPPSQNDARRTRAS